MSGYSSFANPVVKGQSQL